MSTVRGYVEREGGRERGERGKEETRERRMGEENIDGRWRTYREGERGVKKRRRRERERSKWIRTIKNKKGGREIRLKKKKKLTREGE